MYDCISSASFLILNCRFVELTVVTTYQQTDRPTRWSCAKTSFYQVSVALHASHGSMRPIATHMSPVSGATVCVGLGPRDTPVNPAKRLNQLRCRLGADNSRGGSNLKVGGHMASAEREPIRGSGGGAPSGVQGQSPWSGGQGGEAPLKLKCF